MKRQTNRGNKRPVGRKTRPVASGELRIIGGRWRGRKIRFPVSGVRPTGDRVKETLFNWLTPSLPGARCLDLFAGSGALGIEALSRGAAYVVFVEKNPNVAEALRNNLRTFGASPGSWEVRAGDALTALVAQDGPFDVVFVDPPFSAVAKTLEPGNLCTLLESSGVLDEGAQVYLEMPRDRNLPELPAGWVVRRDKTAGQVRYALVTREQQTEAGSQQ